MGIVIYVIQVPPEFEVLLCACVSFCSSETADGTKVVSTAIESNARKVSVPPTHSSASACAEQRLLGRLGCLCTSWHQTRDSRPNTCLRQSVRIMFMQRFVSEFAKAADSWHNFAGRMNGVWYHVAERMSG